MMARVCLEKAEKASALMDHKVLYESNFTQFPFVIQGTQAPECATEIFRPLARKTLLKCRTVCKDWKEYIDSQTSLWKDLVLTPTQICVAATHGNIDIFKAIISVKKFFF